MDLTPLSGMFRYVFDCPWYESEMSRYEFDCPWYALKIRIQTNQVFRCIFDFPVWDVSVCIDVSVCFQETLVCI